VATSYRPEIDGLRALAVVPVILFHAGVTWFSGGFVGVDVFFVISGYLITTIIVNELNAGSFFIAAFYERRARRILPALCVVIASCVAGALFLLPPADFVDFSKSIAAVAAFGSNIYFKNSGSYFQAASETRPLLHTWSLGVEEQFYLFFPWLLIFLWKWQRSLVLPVLFGGALSSLVLGHWGAINRPGGAFYLLPTRSWELLVGALAAIWMLESDLAKRIRACDRLCEALAASGLAMITLSIAVFDAGTLTPGLPLLAPTLGTALVLVCGSQSTAVGRVLSLRPIVGIGLLSYSAYLWHQPLLSYVRWSTVREPSSWQLSVAAISSFAFAYVSWRFVELPYRDKRRVRTRHVWIGALALSAVMFTIGGMGVALDGLPQRFGFSDRLSASLAVKVSPTNCADGEGIERREDWLCSVGPEKAKIEFLFIGDSHAMALREAVDSAARKAGIRGVFSAMSACPPIASVYRQGRGGEVTNCHDLNERFISYARDSKVQLVILASRWSAYTDGGYLGTSLRPLSREMGSKASRDSSRIAFAWGLRETVRLLGAGKARVLIIPQVPEQHIGIPFKLYAGMRNKLPGIKSAEIAKHSAALSEHIKLQEFTRTQFRHLVDSGYVKTLSLDGFFCERDRCLVGDTLESWYRDSHHLSRAGAYRTIPAFVSVFQNRGAPNTVGRGPAPLSPLPQ
jgi:peptidoglycan/LPS O-acetylase OafA/YrhL